MSFTVDIQRWSQAQVNRLRSAAPRQSRLARAINQLLRDRLTRDLEIKTGTDIPAEFIRSGGRLSPPLEYIEYELNHGWLRSEATPNLYLSTELTSWLTVENTFFDTMSVLPPFCPSWTHEIALNINNNYPWPYAASLAKDSPLNTGELIRLSQALLGAGRDINSILGEPPVFPYSTTSFGAIRCPGTAQWWLYLCTFTDGLQIVPLFNNPDMVCYVDQIESGEVVAGTTEWDMVAAALLSAAPVVLANDIIQLLEPDDPIMLDIAAGGGSSLHPFCGWHGLHQKGLSDPAGIVQVFTREVGHYESKKVSILFNWSNDGIPQSPTVTVGDWQSWGGPLFRVRLPDGNGTNTYLLPQGDLVLNQSADVYCFTTPEGIRTLTMAPQVAGTQENLGGDPYWGTICGSGSWSDNFGSRVTNGAGGWIIEESDTDHRITSLLSDDTTERSAEINNTDVIDVEYNGTNEYTDLMITCSACAGDGVNADLGKEGSWTIQAAQGSIRQSVTDANNGTGVAVAAMLPTDTGVFIIDLQKWGSGNVTIMTNNTSTPRASAASWENIRIRSGEPTGSITVLHRYGNACYCLISELLTACSGYGLIGGGDTETINLSSYNGGACTLALSSGETYDLNIEDWLPVASIGLASEADVPYAVCSLHNSVFTIAEGGPWNVTGGVSNEVTAGGSILGVGII